MGLTNERWAAARHELGLKQTDLADLLQTPRSTLAGYERNANIPASAIRAFSEICHIRESYLLNGDFPILEPPEAPTPVQQVVEKYNLPEICAAAMEVWARIPFDEQERIKQDIRDTIRIYNAQHPPDEPSE